MSRRIEILIAALVLLLVLVPGFFLFFHSRSPEPIKVGILHSFTGTMAISETSVADATQMAIEEVNQAGGLLGRKVVAVVRDGRSDWPTFAAEARRLITEEHVDVIFGCWTSASRKTVKPIVEEYGHLLIYPIQYEGLEQSENIIYTGSAPNQQILPAVKWCFDNLGRRFFLVGSDYVFPRTANEIVKAQVAALRGEIVGEEYVLLGETDFHQAVENIRRSQPDVIINDVVGTSILAFYETLRQAGIRPDKIPTMSFTVSEVELESLNAVQMAGDYASWSYFQSIPGTTNQQFVENFRRRYGEGRVLNDPIEAGYFGVHLWAQAVADSGTSEVKAVRRMMRNQSFNAPEGIVYIDAENQHTWKSTMLGRIRADGQFDIVWRSTKPIRPVPFPVFRTRAQWESFVDNLYQSWGGSWSNPGSE